MAHPQTTLHVAEWVLSSVRAASPVGCRELSPPSMLWRSRCISPSLMTSENLGPHSDPWNHIYGVCLPAWPSPPGLLPVPYHSSICYSGRLYSVTYSWTQSPVLTALTTFPSSFLSSHSQVYISAWLVDISNWMPARRFELITSDNNIVNPAQTAKHLIVIPGRKLSYTAFNTATQPSSRYLRS